MNKYLKKEVIWKIREYGSMLYDVRTKKKLKLNQMATNIFLYHFVDRYSADFIAEELLQQYPDVEPLTLKADVNAILNMILSSEFVAEGDDDRGFINLIEPNEQMDYVSIQLTRKCNMSCSHCLEGGNHESSELSFEIICKIIDELSAFKVMEIVWTGGEPLIRSDLKDIIKYATNKNIRSVVFTNGTLIDEDFLESIKSDNVFLRFSLDGAHEETNDKQRGMGSFNKIISGIKKSVQLNIPVGIAVTISKNNIKELNEIVELADLLQVDEIEMSEVEERGSASSGEENLLLNQEELNELREFSLKQTIVNERFRKGMGYQNKKGMEEDIKSKNCCKGGIVTSFINSKGELYPCYLFSQFPETKIGDVTQESIIRLWQKSDFLEKIRNTTIEQIDECVQCDCYRDCNGGCRAKAYEKTGTLNGPMSKEFCIATRHIKEKFSIG